MYVSSLMSRYQFHMNALLRSKAPSSVERYESGIGSNNSNYKLDLSYEGTLRAEYTSKFKKALETNDDSLFIESYAVEYKKQKEDIMNNCPENERAAKLKALDEAFNQSVTHSIDELAEGFEDFFDYSYNTLSDYRMEHGDEVFNSNKFKENLSKILNDCVDIVNNKSGSVSVEELSEALEKSVPSADKPSLEQMSYKDIKGMVDIVSGIQVFNTKDSNTAGTMLIIFNQIGRIKDTKLSGFVKEEAEKAVLNTIKAFHMASAYEQKIAEYDKKIKKAEKEYQPLKARLDSIDEHIKDYKKENNVKLVEIYKLLKLDAFFKLEPVEKRLNTLTSERKSLKDNPSAVKNTDIYKSIDKEFAGLLAEKLKKEKSLF